MGILDRVLRLDGAKAPFDFGLPAVDSSQVEHKWSITVGGGDSPPDYGSAWLIGLPDNVRDFTRNAGDLIDSTAVMACVQWIMRTVAEAPLQVEREDAQGQRESVRNHPLQQLLKRPNPFYSGRLLWRATALSYNINGNAYWLKYRNPADMVIQVWYEPHYTIRPVWGKSGPKGQFIDYYEIFRAGRWEQVATRNVVHLRNGLDPRNPRLGLSPLGAALREVFTDNEAALYAAQLVHNLGVPPLVVSPEGDRAIADPDGLKGAIISKTTGPARGQPLVVGDPVKVSMLAYDPKNMNTRENRKITEERISALLGVPAIVAGLGAGLDRSTFANMSEAREMAYESNIVPTLAQWGDDLDGQLLGDFETDVESHCVTFDLSSVRVLQDDENRRAERIDLLFQGNIIKLNEARVAVGYDKDPDGDQYNRDRTPPPPPATMPVEANIRTGPPRVEGGKSVEGDIEHKGHVEGSPARRAEIEAYARKALPGVRKAFREQLKAVLAACEGRETLSVKDVWDGEQMQGLFTEAYKSAFGAAASAGAQQARTRMQEKGYPVRLETKRVQDYLAALESKIAEHVSQIDATSRKLLAREIRDGIDAGYTVEQIAFGVEADGYAGIKGLFEDWSYTRAYEIAQTETVYVWNLSSLNEYKDEGIEKVVVSDGTDSDEACAAANGQVWWLRDAQANPLQHPHCRREFDVLTPQ